MNWGRGYVTDVEYVDHFTREVSPTWLKIICLLRNVVAPEGPITYSELGSGQGYALNLLAASNPDCTFFGVDFNPSHIVGSRRLASEAALPNVTFIERSFEQLAADLSILPDSDIIVLHGVYTWVGPQQRAALREIITAKLKPGGLLYISYNCMIGWGPIVSLQRLFRDFHRSRGGDSSRAFETINALEKYRDNGLAYFAEHTLVNIKLNELSKKNVSYLAHEYLNEYWEPMFVHDMIKEMADCKLSFVGSARPADNISAFTLGPDLAQVVQTERDPALRECLRDMALNTMFRQDIFVRGLLRFSAPEWQDRLAKLRLILTQPRTAVKMTANVPRGTVQMGRQIYNDALDMLAAGPMSLGDVSSDGMTLLEPTILMLQTPWAAPASVQRVDLESSTRLNAALARRTSGPTTFPFFACPATGSGLRLEPRESRALAALIREPDLSIEAVVDRVTSESEREPVPQPAQDLPAAEPLTADSLEAKVACWSKLGLLQNTDGAM